MFSRGTFYSSDQHPLYGMLSRQKICSGIILNLSNATNKKSLDNDVKVYERNMHNWHIHDAMSTKLEMVKFLLYKDAVSDGKHKYKTLSSKDLSAFVNKQAESSPDSLVFWLAEAWAMPSPLFTFWMDSHTHFIIVYKENNNKKKIYYIPNEMRWCEKDNHRIPKGK